MDGRPSGRMGGRPRKMDRAALMMAMAAMADRKAVAAEVAARLGLTTTTGCSVPRLPTRRGYDRSER